MYTCISHTRRIFTLDTIVSPSPTVPAGKSLGGLYAAATAYPPPTDPFAAITSASAVEPWTRSSPGAVRQNTIFTKDITL